MGPRTPTTWRDFKGLQGLTVISQRSIWSQIDALSKSSNKYAMQYHIRILQQEFSRRAEKNGRYSLRAFAKHLQMHPSALSRILAGKQKISKSAAVIVTEKVALDREKSRLFLQSVIEEHRQVGREELGEAIAIPHLKVHPVKMDEDKYAIIAKLTSLALRELLLTEGFESEPEWLAKRLGVEKDQVLQSLQMLKEVGLVDDSDGQLKHTDRHVTAVDTAESNAIRLKLQKEILTRAMTSLETDPFKKRAHYGMTMAINPEKIESANKMILEFMETLCDFLETDVRKEVYQLAVQLFPLTKTQTTQEGTAQ